MRYMYYLFLIMGMEVRAVKSLGSLGGASPFRLMSQAWPEQGRRWTPQMYGSETTRYGESRPKSSRRGESTAWPMSGCVARSSRAV